MKKNMTFTLGALIIVSLLLTAGCSQKETRLEQSKAAAGLAAKRIEAMCTMNRHYDAHGLTGNANVLRWLLGREPTDFRTFVERDLEDQ